MKQILRLPGDNMRILVEGQYRAKLLDMIHSEPYLFGRVVELDEPGYRHDPLRLQALIRQGHELFGQFVDLAVKAGQESMLQILSSDEPGKLARCDRPERDVPLRPEAAHFGAATPG